MKQYYSIDVFFIDKIYLGIRNIAITLKLYRTEEATLKLTWWNPPRNYITCIRCHYNYT